MILHAGLIALRVRTAWRGALIMGASGSGKSDLAIRAVEHGLRLVADDRTLVWSSGGALYGRAPDTLFGLIEARGLGVDAEPALRFAPISLVVLCCASADEVERLPETAFETIDGVAAPRIALFALEASAPAKLGRALRRLGGEGGAA
jgi:serine kinase of HPr protein (carbohydrate metabolism regulator)